MNTKTAFFGGVAGVLTGYFLAKQTLSKRYEEQVRNEVEEIRQYYVEKTDAEVQKAILYYSEKADREIQQVKNFHAKLLAEVPVPGPEEMQRDQEATEEIEEVLEEYRGVEKTTSGDGKSELNLNFDSDEDLPPYIIPVDVFIKNRMGHEQMTLAYYEGDNKLADQTNTLVSDERIKETIGVHNLHSFGEQSGNPDIVYVRCEQYKFDFEIIRAEGKFSEIAGDDA